MLNEQEINFVISQDEIFNQNIRNNDYTARFHPMLAANWINIATHVIIVANLIANRVNFRFAQLRRHAVRGLKDWFPSKLGDSPVLITFIKSVIFRQFVLERRCLWINFGLTFGVLDAITGPRYFYSSRGNFRCLPNAYLIRSDATFNRFFDKILPNFSVFDYIESVVHLLQPSYTGLLLPLSITFSITRSVGLIYGKAPVKKTKPDNNCVFTALSMKFTVKNGKVKKIEKKEQERMQREDIC